MNEKSFETWKTWAEPIPEEERLTLYEVLRQSLNGRASGKSEAKLEVPITRTPTDDLLIEETPNYVDVNGLHAIYDKIAFETNTILKGPKGIAKTLSVFAYAHVKALPVVVQECSEDTRKYELMGSQTPVGTDIVYVLGSIPTAIEVANEVGHCILLFEEMNALTPQVQKQLNSVADFRKQVSMPHIGRTFKLRKGAKIWIVATMNPSVYGGTYDLNEDLKSRFPAEMDPTYPSFAQEKQIVKASCAANIDEGILDNILRFAGESRQKVTGYALSPRDVVSFMNMVGLVGIENALQMIMGKFEDTDKDIIMKRLIDNFGPKGVKKFWGGQ